MRVTGIRGGFVIAAIVALLLMPVLADKYVDPSRGWAITLMLGLVALSAVLVVMSLGKQLRSTAAAAERSNAELRAATESRARLIRGISHDLKNPLNAIDGHAQLLLNGLRGELSFSQEDSVTRIRGAAAMLIRLVDDLVTLSVAESGHLPLETREVEIGELVREVCEENRATAQTFCHTLSLSIASDVSRIETDPHRVKQILANLVSNSIRCTPPGGHIQIRVQHAVTRLSSEKPECRYLCIAVADDGPGIPPDMMEQVFEEFKRLQNTSDPARTGLGLAIAWRIARLLDGQITAANTNDGGVVFSLLLPA